jgi:4'-phosphopantetheinyl transferase
MPPHEALDEGVRRRIAALRRREDQERHATGAVLADALARVHGGGDARVVRRRGEAPSVDGAEVSLSVAHGGAWVVVAVAALAPVGVDVEPLTQTIDVEGLAEQVLAPSERDALIADPNQARRARALLTAWARKEAVLKATGDGLRVDPRDVVLSPPGTPPRLLAFAGRPELAGACAIADLAPDDEHVGAVAVLAPEPIALEQANGAALLP